MEWIQSVTFIKSSEKIHQLPSSTLLEYAFIGRSNVGKSSLINYLTRKKQLAKTSSKAGKTTTINHFLVNESWYLVDLPGYGYAHCSKEKRAKMQQLIKDYIFHRTTLCTLFLLIDSRIPPQKSDLDFIEILGKACIPFSITFTKVDQLKIPKLKENISYYKEQLAKTWKELPPLFQISSYDKKGREEILTYIKTLQDEIAPSLIK